MACSASEKYYETLNKEVQYLRGILLSLKPCSFRPNCDWSQVVAEQQNTLNTLRGDFAIKVTDLEQRLRQNTLRIFGLKEVPGEDTESVVLRYFQKGLRVGIKESDIDNCHRSGRMRKDKPRPVVAKFTNAEARKRVYNRKDDVKAGMFIVEELCAERRLVRQDAIAKFGRNCVSVADGNVQVELPDGRVEKFSTMQQFRDFVDNEPASVA